MFLRKLGRGTSLKGRSVRSVLGRVWEWPVERVGSWSGVMEEAREGPGVSAGVGIGIPARAPDSGVVMSCSGRGSGGVPQPESGLKPPPWYTFAGERVCRGSG